MLRDRDSETTVPENQYEALVSMQRARNPRSVMPKLSLRTATRSSPDITLKSFGAVPNMTPKSRQLLSSRRIRAQQVRFSRSKKAALVSSQERPIFAGRLPRKKPFEAHR